jgi:putative hydrolase of the HAD superfamily
MINATIFLIWDVFINLDKQANGLKNLGLTQWNEDLDQLNIQFETGKISKKIYYGIQKTHNASTDEILQAWSAILLDFFVSIEFLQSFYTKKYRLFYSATLMLSISKHSNKKMAPLYGDFLQVL